MEKVSLGKTEEMLSKMCLGTMYFGSKVDKKTSFELMDYYYEQGGRVLDTSNNYSFWWPDCIGDESELTIGEWMKERGNRNEIFLATKVGARPVNPEETEFEKYVFEELSKDTVFNAVEKSLERLQTDYIDLYYIHVDWRKQPLEETLSAFNDLVESGKVKHIACSNMDTWRLVKAKEISRKNGWSEFSAIQQWYSYLKPRENADLWVQKFVNDELLDYCRTEKDTTIFAYSSTVKGIYKSDNLYDKNYPGAGDNFYSEQNERRFEVLAKLAKKKGVSKFEIVFAWILKHDIPIIPILGVSSLSQLKSNLSALKIKLTDEEFELMNNAAFNGKTHNSPNPSLMKFYDSKISAGTT